MDSKSFLNKNVTVKVDRPLGSIHPQYDTIYPINYGFVPHTKSGDAEEIDAYIIGADKPLTEFTGKCIAIIKRVNDEDDKLIVVPEGMHYSDNEIKNITHFQEQYFESKIIRN